MCKVTFQEIKFKNIPSNLNKEFIWLHNQLLFEEDPYNEMRLFEIFLRKIPHVIEYDDEAINEANILLISNEPGLTNICTLYIDFLKCIKEKNFDIDQCKETLIKGFKISMESWLKIENHDHLNKPNGDRKLTDDDPCEMKKFKKVGFFLDLVEDDQQLINFDNKIINIDLCNYPQKMEVM